METLQQLGQRLWTPDIVPEIKAMVVWLLDIGGSGLQLCKDILTDPLRAALCETQVVMSAIELCKEP